MLVHFPVALWPAHAALHVFASRLPAGVGAVAGFWLLGAGVALGWLALCAGAFDLREFWRARDETRFNAGVVHGAVNGSVLLGFTCLLAAEYPSYPAIVHGVRFLLAEAALLVAMIVGNYFGAAIVWPRQDPR
jgi:uncharacterized membrane protein